MRDFNAVLKAVGLVGSTEEAAPEGGRRQLTDPRILDTRD